MKTFIVLFEIENNTNARKQCENIENQLLKIKHKEDGYTNLTAFKVREAIYDYIENNDIGITVYSLTDFMDECNNQDIKLENYFLTYVQAELV